MEYEIKKTLTGKTLIVYACESCNSELKSNLREAGKKDTCPICSHAFVVPGADDLKANEERLQKERAEAKQKAEAKKKERQEAAAKAAAAMERQEAEAAKKTASREKSVQAIQQKDESERNKMLQQAVMQQPQKVVPQYHCPYCQSTAAPINKSKTSSAGWVFFWLTLLVLCFPICWIGLLIKDHYRICPTCGNKIG